MFIFSIKRNVSRVIKGLVVATALVAVVACSEAKTDEVHESVRPVKVTEVAAPEYGHSLQYSGSVQARTEMNLGFQVTGKIAERLVDVGDRVNSGDVLARLDAIDYQLAARRAEADLASASKQVEISGLARRRAESLVAKNVVSQSELEQAILANELAVSLRDSAQSALDQANNQVAYTELKADRSGIVTSMSANVGEVVAAGTRVVSVAADGEKEVQIAVPETDIAHFKVGQRVQAQFWSVADLLLDGTVREVAGSADPRSRTFAVRVTLPADPRVLLGMTAAIEAVQEDAAPAWSIPLTALSGIDSRPFVWIVDPTKGTVTSREVAIADFSDNGVRISHGLAEGDLVVSAGTQFMKQDLKVRLTETAALRLDGIHSINTASITP